MGGRPVARDRGEHPPLPSRSEAVPTERPAPSKRKGYCHAVQYRLPVKSALARKRIGWKSAILSPVSMSCKASTMTPAARRGRFLCCQSCGHWQQSHKTGMP